MTILDVFSLPDIVSEDGSKVLRKRITGFERKLKEKGFGRCAVIIPFMKVNRRICSAIHRSDLSLRGAASATKQPPPVHGDRVVKERLVTLAANVMFALGAVFLAACAPVKTEIPSSPTPLVELIPYLTATATSTPTPQNPATATPLPSPTPTPLTYTVQTGDSFLEIALRYKISLGALQSANPKVNPNSMSIGTVLTIPAGGAAAQVQVSPSPTPVGVSLGKVYCANNQDGGVWCFVPVYNGQSLGVEGLSAVIRIASKGSTKVTSQTATAPLDLIPSKATLALSAYFPAPTALPDRASAELLTALPVLNGDPRYLPVRIGKPQYQVDPDGLSAQASGELILNANKVRANQVWVAAVAYDQAGDVVGLRRWQSATPLSSGAGLSFAFDVYSVSETISRVDLLAEARP
jgi:LysM repeat protein